MKNQNITQKLVTLIFIINVMCTLQLKSQNLNWDKSYAHDNYESHGYSIQPIATGGYIVCGSAITDGNGKDIYLLKTNEDGDTLWTKVIGGTNDDEGYCVHQCLDGGFIIAGYTASYGNGGFDFFLVKTNSAGAVQWTRTNGGTLNEGSYNIIQTNDSGFLAVGYTYSTGGGGSDVRAVKYTKYGVVQWSKTYGNAYNQIGYSVCQMRDSGFVICGSTARGVSDSLDVYVIKTNLNGDTLWTHTYKHEGYDCAYAVQPCNETGFVIAGKTNLKEGAHTDMLFMKIFDDGTPIFTQTYGVTGYDEVAYDVKETETNSFILVGTTNANSQGTDGYVVHTDDHGELLESTYYGGDSNDDFRGVCMKNDNTFAATGTVSNTLLLAEYTNCEVALPRTLWFNNCWEFNSCNSSSDKKQSLFVDNNAFVTAAIKIDEFVDYCKQTKMHTVVLGRLEDIIRQDVSGYTDYPSPISCLPCSTLNGGAFSGNVLRNMLFDLVYRLHIDVGVSVVLAQWRDAVKDDALNPTINKYNEVCSTLLYPFDEDNQNYTHSEQILNRFVSLNGTQLKPYRFDGIMMDYEYFTPKYGYQPSASGPAYKFARPGFVEWLKYADKIIAKKNINGIGILQAYLSRVVFTADGIINPNGISEGFFNYHGLIDPNDVTTDRYDSQLQLWEIDQKGFDKLSLAFFVDDQMNYISPGINPVPTTFLSGFAENISNLSGDPLQNDGDQTEEQRYRWRVEIFGDALSGKETKFEPVFLSRNNKYDSNLAPPLDWDCGGTMPKAMLGNLLLGECYWDTGLWPLLTGSAGAHYLHEIEGEFYDQFTQQKGVDDNNANDPWIDPNYANFAYGDCKLSGFQWYQYSTYRSTANTSNNDLIAISSESLTSRANDKITFKRACEQNRAGVNNMTAPTITTQTIKKTDADYSLVSINPNPVNKNGSLLSLKDIENYTIKFTNVYGNDVTDKVFLQKLKDYNYNLIPTGLQNGIYILKITYGNDRKFITKFTVIK